MRKEKMIGLLALAATFLFAGCSGSVEIGPVPTITPRPTVTPAPTPTPVVVVQEQEEVKEVSVYETKKYKEYYEKENKLPQLKEAYKDVFSIGLDASLIDIMDEKRQAIVKEQFNQLTIKEDLTPENIMDYETAKVSEDKTRIPLNFSAADTILKFAKDNNISVMGPKLMTEATPEWAFSKDLDRNQVVVTTDEEGNEVTTIEYASAEVMLARMENYIKDVITYCNTNYPGVVISWTVLDEPINAGETTETMYRANYWLKTIGDDYIVKACEFARKYATASQKLLLTQDALDEEKTLKPSLVLINKLKDAKLIDGIGIKAHYSPNSPNVFNMEDMMKKLSATGLDLHLTEYYVDCNEGNRGDLDKTDEERLARGVKRSKALMTNILNYDVKSNYDIKSISLEALTNDYADVNQPKDYIDHNTLEVKFGVQVVSFPCIFDEDLNVSDVFFAFMGDATIKGY
ncbi:MAG: endo-1,4-beta-xylanase [Lachnospiraceae bacterium]|nr:endo-1,4-beta-xylanase [Lachnospiraceae bacterium]